MTVNHNCATITWNYSELFYYGIRTLFKLYFLLTFSTLASRAIAWIQVSLSVLGLGFLLTERRVFFVLALVAAVLVTPGLTLPACTDYQIVLTVPSTVRLTETVSYAIIKHPYCRVMISSLRWSDRDQRSDIHLFFIRLNAVQVARSHLLSLISFKILRCPRPDGSLRPSSMTWYENARSGNLF